MAKEPRPGMGQKEKDELGAKLHEAHQREVELEAAAATVGTWRPDIELGAMEADELRAEAGRRGLTLPKTVAKEEATRRLVERRKAVQEFIDRRAAAGAVPPTGA